MFIYRGLPCRRQTHRLTFSQELTFIIKQDIANVNRQIASLQSHLKQRNAQGASRTTEGKQMDEHSHNVVMMLQSKLATTSMTFKDVLEVRTQVCLILVHETRATDRPGRI